MVRLPRLLLLGVATVMAGFLAGAEPVEIAALRSKAEQGNALAQYNLGLAYSTGQQVPANSAEAFAWLSLAADNGTTGRALDDLLSNLTDRQLAEGRQRYAQYRAAISARLAQTNASREAARRSASRGFSLAPTAPVPPEPTPESPLTRPPDPAGSAVPVPPATLEAENARLRAELARAQAKIRDQAATIERLNQQAKAAAGTKPGP